MGERNPTIDNKVSCFPPPLLKTVNIICMKLVPLEHLQFSIHLVGSLSQQSFQTCQNINLHHLAHLLRFQKLTQGEIHGGISTTLKTKIVYHNLPP